MMAKYLIDMSCECLISVFDSMTKSVSINNNTFHVLSWFFEEMPADGQ